MTSCTRDTLKKVCSVSTLFIALSGTLKEMNVLSEGYLINANPFDRIERPKKSKFQGDHYSEKELYTLLELAKTDTIYPVIILAGGLGMRRSEALGVRWSRIDWEKKTVLLDTKVVMYDQNGKSVVESVEQMKNKTSCRTLPIPGPVLEMLKEEKEKQEMYRRTMSAWTSWEIS